ncbi:hypothetical protein Ddc_24640 [Ditylenchus destructor]|nr:hypothetical protein Ddc_24640 [Ditylenchus destructor]
MASSRRLRKERTPCKIPKDVSNVLDFKRIRKVPNLRKADELFGLTICPKKLRKKIRCHLLGPAPAKILEEQVCIDPDYWASCWDATDDKNTGKNEAEMTNNQPIETAADNDSHKNRASCWDATDDTNTGKNEAEMTNNQPIETATDYDSPKNRYFGPTNHPRKSQKKNKRKMQRTPDYPAAHTLMDPDEWAACWDAAYDNSYEIGKNNAKQDNTENVTAIPFTGKRNEDWQHKEQEYDRFLYDIDSDDDFTVTIGDIRPTIYNNTKDSYEVPAFCYNNARMEDGFRRPTFNPPMGTQMPNLHAIHNPQYGQPPSYTQLPFINCAHTGPPKQITGVDIRHFFQIPALWNGTTYYSGFGNASAPPMPNCPMPTPTPTHSSPYFAPATNFYASPPVESYAHSNFAPQIPNLNGFPPSLSTFNNNARPLYPSAEQRPMNTSTIYQKERRSNVHGYGRKKRTRYGSPSQQRYQNIGPDENKN